MTSSKTDPGNGPESDATIVDRARLRTVAMIGANDTVARTLVEERLRSRGIRSFAEGSVVYAVQVFAADYRRARAALETDAALAKHWIEFVEESDS